MNERKEEEIERIPEWMRDGLELKYVLKAISDFLRDIREPIENIMNSIMSFLSGDKLGNDVGNFYKNIVNSGVPEDLAKEMTKEYFESRIAVVKMLKDVMENIQSLRRESERGELTKSIQEIVRKSVSRRFEEEEEEKEKDESS